MNLGVSNHCWICEGWSCVKFTISKTRVEQAAIKGKPKGTPPGDLFVSIHFNFDLYKIHRIYESTEGGKQVYNHFMMVPPGPLNYFYALTDAENFKKENLLRPFVDSAKPSFFPDAMTIKVD